MAVHVRSAVCCVGWPHESRMQEIVAHATDATALSAWMARVLFPDDPLKRSYSFTFSRALLMIKN
jgi:hypothetical protein